jgi:hypothetical protein
MDSASGHIEIVLVPGAIPISGHVHARGEAVRPFTGWTALFAALRAAVGEDDVAHEMPAGSESADTIGGH